MRSASRLLAGLLWLLLAYAASAGVQEPKILERTPVEYPPAARRLGHEGTVTVSVEVLTDGSIGATSVVTSSGSPLLDEAGMSAVRGWRFAPATGADGKPALAKSTVRVEFKLTDSEVGPDTPLSESTPTTEAGRLGMIWLAYRSYRSFGEAFLSKCEAAGVDAEAARAANRKLNAEADARFSKLEPLLKLAIAASGSDPDRQLDEIGQRLDTDIKLRAAASFAEAVGPDEQRRNCASFVASWGSIEGSFRFNEYYERLMAL